MRHLSFTLVLWTALTLTSSRAGTANTQVAPKGSAAQNASDFSKVLQDYEATHGAHCTNVTFTKFQQPVGTISPHSSFCGIAGASLSCGTRVYHAQITFSDTANTVVSELKILFGPEEESDYRQKAMEFIRDAQSGDLKQMLAITSPQTHATGSDSVRTAYANHVIPAFHATDVIWDPLSRTVTDEKGNAGLMFTGTSRGNKTRTFDVVVYKENGTLVVASIQNHH